MAVWVPRRTPSWPPSRRKSTEFEVEACSSFGSGPAPDAVGHRLVHGGDRFDRHGVVDEAALAGLDAIQDMAPLHNPPAIALVRACARRYPDLPQAVVFDTAYHATIPDYARTYALPEALRRDLGLRKFGFHGTSHQYVAEEAARLRGRPLDELNAVSCHLGSGGASLCAIANGRSLAHSCISAHARRAGRRPPRRRRP